MAVLSCMWAVGHRVDMLARASGDSENLSPAGCLAAPGVHFPVLSALLQACFVS